MNTIQITKEDVILRIVVLQAEKIKQKDKQMINIIDNQIKYWRQVLDRFYLNESFRNTGKDYYSQDFFNKREADGWIPYNEGYTAVGNAIFPNIGYGGF